MKTHSLRLHPEPFEKIASGSKTIEARLYDEKRQQIQIGDTLEFISRFEPNQVVKAKVVGLLRADTFNDLFTVHRPVRFGGVSVKNLNNAIGQFYTLEDQLQHGVVGIEFELI